MFDIFEFIIIFDCVMLVVCVWFVCELFVGCLLFILEYILWFCLFFYDCEWKVVLYSVVGGINCFIFYIFWCMLWNNWLKLWFVSERGCVIWCVLYWSVEILFWNKWKSFENYWFLRFWICVFCGIWIYNLWFKRMLF